jgi:hypothetical protein
MQPRNFAAAAAGAELELELEGVAAGADDDEVLVDGVVLLGLDELLPQPAISRLAAAAAAAVTNAVCFTVSSTGPSCYLVPRRHGASPHGPDCPQISPGRVPWEEAGRHCRCLVAELRPDRVASM